MDFIVDSILNAELQTLSQSKIKVLDLFAIPPTTHNIASANANIQPPQPGKVRIVVFAKGFALLQKWVLTITFKNLL